MNPRRSLEAALLVAAFATAPLAAHADAIYKYVDEKGNVTYSSTPPKGGGKAEKIDAPVTPTPEQAAAARRQLELDKEQLRKAQEQRSAQEAEAAKLRSEQLAKERELAANQSAQTATEAEEPVYYPVWGFRRPVRPIQPWPRPEEPISPYTPTPSNPQMAKPAPRQ